MDTVFAIFAAAFFFCLVIAAAIVAAQGREIRRLMADITSLIEACTENNAEIERLERALTDAQRNDRRGPDGRYARQAGA